MCMTCVNGAEVRTINYTLPKDSLLTGTTLQPSFSVVKIWRNYSITGIIQQVSFNNWYHSYIIIHVSL